MATFSIDFGRILKNLVMSSADIAYVHTTFPSFPSFFKLWLIKMFVGDTLTFHTCKPRLLTIKEFWQLNRNVSGLLIFASATLSLVILATTVTTVSWIIIFLITEIISRVHTVFLTRASLGTGNLILQTRATSGGTCSLAATAKKVHNTLRCRGKISPYNF